MKDGFRVYDADTHVNPAAEVLERYVDPGFRPRLAELAPYRQASGEGRHLYSFGRKFYRRVLGEAAPRETFTGRESQWRGGKLPRPGVQDDQAENRVKDMDDEGTDIHFLIPGSFMSLVGLDDPAFEVGLIRAYHRHMADFCGRFPTRLKSLIVASTRNVEAAVREIREWGDSKWAVAVKPLMPFDIPPDQLDLEPALLPGLPGRLGQHLRRPHGIASVGGDALRRVLRWRRHHGPPSEAADGGARMRLWLAAVLGQAHGRAGRLCRRHRVAQAQAERISDRRPLFLQYRAPGGRGHVQYRHRLSRRRHSDVRVRLPALGVPVPAVGRQHPRVDEPRTGHAQEAPLGQRQPLLQAGVIFVDGLCRRGYGWCPQTTLSGEPAKQLPPRYLGNSGKDAA